MPDRIRITELEELEELDGEDFVPVVDVSDATQSPDGSTKKIKVNQFVAALPIGEHLAGSWGFDTSTSIGGIDNNGRIWLNTDPQTDASLISFTMYDEGAVNRSEQLENFGASTNPSPKGYLYIASSTFPGTHGQILVTLLDEVIIDGLVRSFNCMVRSLNGIPLTDESVTVIFQPVGDAGEDGADLADNGVLAGFFVEGDGTSGLDNIPNNSPRYRMYTGIARINGIQSLPDQIPTNTFIGEAGHATLPRIDYACVVQPGVFPPDPTFDTLMVSGVAAASPVPPTLTPGQLAIAMVEVPPLATDASECTITDVRVYVPQRYPAFPILVSPDNSTWRIIIGDDGALDTELIQAG